MGQNRDTATVAYCFARAAARGQVCEGVQGGETPVVRPRQPVRYLWPLSSWVAWQSWDSEFALQRERRCITSRLALLGTERKLASVGRGTGAGCGLHGLQREPALSSWDGVSPGIPAWFAARPLGQQRTPLLKPTGGG